MSNRLFIWSLTSALAGFLFGFDTVVISGAEKTIKALWDLNLSQHGLAMSMALWGMVPETKGVSLEEIQQRMGIE